MSEAQATHTQKMDKLDKPLVPERLVTRMKIQITDQEKMLANDVANKGLEAIVKKTPKT